MQYLEKLCCCLFIVVLQAMPARGLNLTWDGNGAAPLNGGAGTWNTALARWWDGSAFLPWNNQDNHGAIFAGTGGAVQVSESVSAQSLSFQSNGYALSGQTLSISGSNIDVAPSTTALINNPLIANNLTKTGNGTLTLYSWGSFTGMTGGIDVSSGTLCFTGAGHLVAPVTGSGTLMLQLTTGLEFRNDVLLTGPFVMNGGYVQFARSSGFGTGSVVVNANGGAEFYQSTVVGNTISATATRSFYIKSQTSGTQLRFTGSISGPLTLTQKATVDSASLSIEGDNRNWTGALEVSRNSVYFASQDSLPRGAIRIGVFDDPAAIKDCGLYGAGTVTHPLGGSNGITFQGSSYSGGNLYKKRYLGASGGTLHVNFGGASPPSTITWGQQGFWPNGDMELAGMEYPLILHNPVNLGSTTAYRRVIMQGQVVAFNGVVSGTGTFQHGGDGTLELNANNNFSGYVWGGGFALGAPRAIPAGVPVLVSGSGSTLTVKNGVAAIVDSIRSSPSGSYTGMTIDASAGTLIFRGDIDNPPLPSAWGGLLTFLGNVDIGDGTRIWNANYLSIDQNACLTGTAGLRIPGDTKVRFMERSTYSGGTRIEGPGVSALIDTVGPAGAPTAGPFGTGPVYFDANSHNLSGDPLHPTVVANPVVFSADMTLYSLHFTGPVTLGSGTRQITTYYSSEGGDYTVSFDAPLDATGTTGLVVVGPSAVELNADNSGFAGTISLVAASFPNDRGSLRVKHPNGLGNKLAGTTVGNLAQLYADADVQNEPLLLQSTTYDTSYYHAPPALRVNADCTWTGDVHYIRSAAISGTVNGDIIDNEPGHPGSLDFTGPSAANHFNCKLLWYRGTLTLNRQLTPRASVFSNFYFSIANQARLDLNANGLVMDYSGASTFDALYSRLKTGYAGGAWTGYGIMSSLVAEVGGSIGIAEASALGISTFLGEPVDSTAVLVRYTLAGDTNLDGLVNTVDFNHLAGSFGQTGAFWLNGDFDYDGVVSSLDFNQLIANYGSTAIAAPTLGAVIPEPAAGIILAVLCALRRGGGRCRNS